MTEKSLGYVELEWKCPNCGSRMPGSVRVCKQCGTPQPEYVQFEMGAAQEIVTDETKLAEAKAAPDIQCGYCGARNPSTASICQQCGAALAEGQARQAGQVVGAFQPGDRKPVNCLACGTENPAGALACSKCGAPLGRKEVSPAPSAAKPAAVGGGIGKIPIFVLLGLVAVAALFIILGTRRQEVAGQVSDVGWRRAIAIEALRPVTREAWREDIPAGAPIGSCVERVYRVSPDPEPGAKEVCGTPFAVDTGTGFGELKQECQYEIYEDWCDYEALGWVTAAPLVLQGSDLNPRWPQVMLQDNQRAGGRSEELSVRFTANDKTYVYHPDSLEEFARFVPGTKWRLRINSFGDVQVVEE